MLVISTLAAPERHRLAAVRRTRKATPEPEPHSVATDRATVIDVGSPSSGPEPAGEWLARAGEAELAESLDVLNRSLHAFRLATADPYARFVARDQLLVARVGYGAGEQVADGLWTDARELLPARGRSRRGKALQGQARFAAVLGGHEQALVCEELTLRARLDLDHGHDREAAMQLLIALDAALSELPRDPASSSLGERLTELRAHREATARASEAALEGPLGDSDRAAVAFTLGRLEAALRARAVAGA